MGPGRGARWRRGLGGRAGLEGLQKFSVGGIVPTGQEVEQQEHARAVSPRCTVCPNPFDSPSCQSPAWDILQRNVWRASVCSVYQSATLVSPVPTAALCASQSS
mmetsp:Transcript_4235/g.7829  ORF Transcript_4235/g.7829 Transcript_4235/m.7829 type:complete len:104 (+) Transcript_4235:983-1294(+)